MDTLTVYAYGNVDALRGIFNAIAMVMASNDFADMMRVGIVLGFLVVATLTALPGNLSKSWSWFLSVTVLSSVLLVPKANVAIVDKLGVQAPTVVANVPWSLALMASIKSSLGATLTQMFETAFQTIPSARISLPAELSYMDNGMMFGARLIQQSRDAQPISAYTRANLIQFIRNCVFPEQGRSAGADEVMRSTDLSSTISGMTNPALSTSYYDVSSVRSVGPMTVDRCDRVWTRITADLNRDGAEAIRKAAQQTVPDLYAVNRPAAIAKVEASMTAIYTKAALAGASATATQIARQNILINAMAEASAIHGAAINDPATLLFSQMRTQAVQQGNAGNLVQGRLAEETLPVIRNITEAILFATFPVLCILLVASEGKALMGLFKGYVFVLLWVELWPPMFSIVNYLQTLEAAKTFAGAGYLGGGDTGLAISTASEIFNSSLSTLGVTAWMVTFVPVIAAALLFGFDKIMAITGVSGGMQRAAQSEAAQTSKGNLSMGNVGFDQQQLAAYRSDPAMLRTESLGGVEFGNVLTGSSLNQYRNATAPVSLADTAAITRGMAAEATQSTQLAQRSGKAAEQALDAAYSTALSAVRSNGVGTSRSLGWDVSKVGSDGLAASDVRELAEKIAAKHQITDVSSVSKALSAGTAGLPIPVFGIQGRTESGESLQKDLSAGVETLRKLGSQRKQELVDQFRHGDAFEEARRSNREAARRVESSAREAQTYRETEAAELNRSNQLSAKVEGAERFQRESSVNWLNLLDQFARARHGMSVHDGIADPRKWQQVVRSFIEAGSIRTDTADGRVMWIPPDPGLGPDALAPQMLHGARGVAAGGEAGLQGALAVANPGGGRVAVTQAGTEFAGRATREQQGIGLRPDGTVQPGSVKSDVERGQQAVRAATTTAQQQVEVRQGEARLELKQRAGNVSTFHKPASTDPNKALDQARATVLNLNGPFKDEAAREQARREKELAESAKARIPGAPHDRREQ